MELLWTLMWFGALVMIGGIYQRIDWTLKRVEKAQEDLDSLRRHLEWIETQYRKETQ